MVSRYSKVGVYGPYVAILNKGQRENGCVCEGATRKNDVDMFTRGIETEIA